MEFDAELLKEFLNESWDNLAKLDQDFVELEKSPGDLEIITRIFRVIHTLKGCSALLGFTRLEQISHYSEDILSQMREKTRPVEPPVITKLLEAADCLKEILTVVEETHSEGDKDYTTIIDQLRGIASNQPTGKKEEASTPTKPASVVHPSSGHPNWQVTVYMEDEEKMPSVRALVVVENLAKVGKIEECIPNVKADQELKPGEPLLVLITSDKSREEILKAASATSIRSAEVEFLEETSTQGISPAPVSVAGTTSQAETEQKQKTTVADRQETTIRIDVDVIDKLMNLVGELVLSRNQIMQFSTSIDNSSFNAACHRISLVTSELQENIMKTRMQPIANVFNRYPRMVRDLATDFGKQVELIIEGKETELDRTLVEAIKDPMVHILRNSMDHGIESPEERVRKGKSMVGSLLIKAFHEGGQVNILVKDDGAGIDVSKVKETAVRKGVITQQQAEQMNDRDAINLIFAPGFSTAKTVTNVSGRGVGMDVVRTNIEKIGGSVDVQTELGKGTTITVKIPLTLAIIPALLVSTGGEKFAIPQVNLLELVCLEGEDIQRKIESVRGVEVFRLRGELLPLVRLSNVLNMPPNEGAHTLYIVVLSAGNGQIGLIVDRVFDTEEIVVKPLSKHLKHLEAYAGATILGDGRVSLILDVQGIVNSAGIQLDEIKAEAEIEAEQEASKQRRMMEHDMQNILLFRLGSDSQFAIPLGLVNRLEEFPKRDIEMASGHEVIQYRGEILPLIRPEYLLQVSGQAEEKETVPVVVFAFESKQAGLVVAEILDIQEVSAEFSRASVVENGVLGNAIIHGKTTEFLDIYRILEMALPEWFQATSTIAQAKGEVVLLVDDSPFYRTMVRSYLEAAGYMPLEASSGTEALEMLEKYEVQLVLTDLEMPEMSGFDMVQQMRENDNYRNIPVVALTAYGDEPHRSRAEEVGIDAFLVKLDRNEMLRTLDGLLKVRA